jgi:hypothetical protein
MMKLKYTTTTESRERKELEVEVDDEQLVEAWLGRLPLPPAGDKHWSYWALANAGEVWGNMPERVQSEIRLRLLEEKVGNLIKAVNEISKYKAVEAINYEAAEIWK